MSVKCLIKSEEQDLYVDTSQILTMYANDDNVAITFREGLQIVLTVSSIEEAKEVAERIADLANAGSNEAVIIKN